MESGMKVYVLTSGEYSDYRVEGVFSTPEKAVAYADGVEDANLPPDEYEVDGAVPVAERWWRIYFDADGNITSIRNEWRKPRHTESSSSAGPNHILVQLFADTRERAIKVASERRAQYLALK
jgi:hypothetical protein